MKSLPAPPLPAVVEVVPPFEELSLLLLLLPHAATRIVAAKTPIASFFMGCLRRQG